jgi:hypothetical protein
MERIRRHLSYANVVATLAWVFAMTGGAIAATGGFTSGGKLQACVNEEGGLKLLKAGKHCKRGQKTIAWNQTGPSGAAGAKGAAGATGALGATGASIQGPKGESGQPTNVMWAKIGREGTIEDGNGVIGVKDNGTSPYTVTFEKDVTNCAVVATQNDNSTSVVTTAKTEANLGNGAEVWIVGRELGAPVERRFSIIAVC